MNVGMGWFAVSLSQNSEHKNSDRFNLLQVC